MMMIATHSKRWLIKIIRNHFNYLKLNNFFFKIDRWWCTPRSRLIYQSERTLNSRYMFPQEIPNIEWFSSVTQSYLTLCDLMDCSMPGLPVQHQLPEFAQTHVHQVGDAIQPSHPLLSRSPALTLSQHQGLSQCISSSHQVTKIMVFQLQHQSFQWIFRTDFL